MLLAQMSGRDGRECDRWLTLSRQMAYFHRAGLAPPYAHSTSAHADVAAMMPRRLHRAKFNTAADRGCRADADG